MRPVLRTLLDLISVGVTAFIVLVFLVGDWTAVYGADLPSRVLWVVLLSSSQTFLHATFKMPGRWERAIGWGKWILVGFTGVFLLLAGILAIALLAFIPGLFVGAFAIVAFVGVILTGEGLWMLWWLSKHRRPILVPGQERGAA